MVMFLFHIFNIQCLLIQYYDQINTWVEKFKTDKYDFKSAKKALLSIPILLITYYDLKYSSFSLKNLGVNSEYNDNINAVLKMLGSYGIIQVFAQDTGIKTAILQNDIVTSHILFTIISIGMAYALTTNRSQSILALILYYHLKYVIADNVTDLPESKPEVILSTAPSSM